MMSKLERQKNKIESAGSKPSSEPRGKSLQKKLVELPRDDLIGVLQDCAVWLGPGTPLIKQPFYICTLITYY